MSEKIKYNVITEEVPCLGFGTPGAANYEARVNALSDEIDIDAVVGVVESSEPISEVCDVDCGCIDGRRAMEVHYAEKDGKPAMHETEDSTIHDRYKVAGGGYVTGVAIMAGVGVLGSHVNDDVTRVIEGLAKDDIFCGTHNGCHEHGENSDCGANDNMKLIFENAVKHESAIKNSINGLLDIVGLSIGSEAINDVFDNLKYAAQNEAYFEGSCGHLRHEKMKKSIDNIFIENEDIEKPVAVSKKLAGEHQELFIIINFCKGMTFSQPTFRLMLAEKYPNVDIDRLPQAFVIDIARIEEIAKSIADQNGSDYMQTLVSGIIYQLATAATLTDGSLRTFIVKLEN